MKDTNILVTKQEILKTFGITDGQFYELVKAGAPARKAKGGWLAHMGDFEEFLRKWCRKSA